MFWPQLSSDVLKSETWRSREKGDRRAGAPDRDKTFRPGLGRAGRSGRGDDLSQGAGAETLFRDKHREPCVGAGLDRRRGRPGQGGFKGFPSGSPTGL